MRGLVRHIAAGAVLTAGILCAATGRGAETETPGRWLYLKYCGACHGADGKGDGVASGFMRPKPTDLTQLAKKAGGTFPYVPTMQVIDGTKTVSAHGDPNMPVWGEIFRLESGAPMEHRVDVQGKIMLITDYIRSIQEK
jgi:mono/diheme cytochrome c family protein